MPGGIQKRKGPNRGSGAGFGSGPKLSKAMRLHILAAKMSRTGNKPIPVTFGRKPKGFRAQGSPEKK